MFFQKDILICTFKSIIEVLDLLSIKVEVILEFYNSLLRYSHLAFFVTVSGIDSFNNDIFYCLMSDFIIYHIFVPVN